MVARSCRVRHCGEPTSSRFSPYCRHHKSTHRRQGDPTQTAISTTELKPFRDRVTARIAKNRDNPLWDRLDALWGNLVEQARADAGRQVGNRYQRRAAQELLNIDADSTPREIVVTTLAMFVLWHDMPGRFRSDAAFRLQLARRARALTNRHTGLVYDHATGKQRRIYREMTPKAGNIIGQKLSGAFGAAGFQLALLDERDREEARKAKDAIATAIKELK